ncbi:MAG: glycosyl hydrolase, partial [Gemmatimonadota bacterium]|nr:glycosyl hydrolase [Gemmatimonadota bacterium]
RYPGAVVFDCMIIWSGSPEMGPIAVPGTYQVKVTANGVTQTQPIVVRLDPRLKGVTVQDVTEQFSLASQTRDRVSTANEAVIRIRRLKSQIANRLSKDTDAKLAASGAALSAKLSAIEEDLYQVRNRSGQDPLNFPIKLNNRLAALERSIESGDGKPTAGSYVVLKELSAELDAHLAKLNALTGTEVPAFNARLTARKLEPLREPPATVP